MKAGQTENKTPSFFKVRRLLFIPLLLLAVPARPQAGSTPGPSVGFTKTVSEVWAQTNDAVTYTLTLANGLGASLDNVTIVDSLPPASAVSYLPGTASNGGSYDPLNNQLTWSILPVSAGATILLTYTARVGLLAGLAGPLVNTAVLNYSGGTASASQTLRLAGGYVIQMGVYNEAGEQLKGFQVFETSIPLSNLDVTGNLFSTEQTVLGVSYQGTTLGTWDATDSSGKKVTNGKYFLKVTSTDPYGISTLVTREWTVAIPRVSLDVTVFNESGEAVKHFNRKDLEALVSGPLLPEDYDVGKAKAGPDIITPSYLNPTAYGNYATLTLGSGRSFPWTGRGDDGRILTNGRYFIEITSNAADKMKEGTLASITVAGQEGNPIEGLSLAPNPVNLNQTGQAVFRIDTGMENMEGARVRVYTLTGELRESLANDPGTPTQVTWNLGKERLSSGTYVAVAELYSGGKVVARRSMKVFLVH